MKAIVKMERKPKALELQHTVRPDIGDDEVLVKVAKAAVCGTDLHVYEYTPGYEFIRTPLIIGHEFSGVVEQTGSAVSGFSIGERVMGESNRYCGQCENCKKGNTPLCLHSKMTGLHVNGSMAEYIAVPAYTLHKLPEQVSFIEGAVAQPISVSLHAVFDHSPIEPGDRVVVFGPGVQGLIAAEAARIKGAGRVAVVGTDIDAAARLKVAAEMNHLAVNAERRDLAGELRKHWGQDKADVVIDASGAAAAIEQGLSILKRGGHLTALGIYSRPVPVDFTALVRSGITIHTSYTSGWKHYEQALQLIASGHLDISPMLSVYDFDDAASAFEDGVSKKAIKPVLQLSEC